MSEAIYRHLMFFRCARILYKFSGKVTRQVTLQYDPNLWIGNEIPFECFNVPTQHPRRFLHHSIHVRRGASQQQCGSYDVPLKQVAEKSSVFRQPHSSAHYKGTQPWDTCRALTVAHLVQL